MMESVGVLSNSRVFVSGAVAGVIADSLLHPFDTISLRMKIQTTENCKYQTLFSSFKTIIKEEGVRGCFGGLGTTLMSSPACAAMYFGTYEFLKSSAPPTINSSFVYFGAGALSELAISLISVPSEVIKSKLQLGRNPHASTNGRLKYTRNYTNTFHAFNSILRKEGIQGLYRGYTACVTVDVLFSGVSFLVYETLKRKVLAMESKSVESTHALTGPQSLALGSAAGGIAAALTNPIDVISVRLMTSDQRICKSSLASPLILIKELKQLVKSEGVSALSKGTGSRMLAVMPQYGICFGVYEFIKTNVFDGNLPDFEE